MVRTTNKSCLNSIIVYEPGDAGHSREEDCLGVGGFCAGGLFLCWKLSPAPVSPQEHSQTRRDGGEGGTRGGAEGCCNGKGRSWSLAAGAPLGQKASGSQCSSTGPAVPGVLLLLRQIQCSCSWAITALELLQNRLLFPHCCGELSACRMPVPAPRELQHQPRD